MDNVETGDTAHVISENKTGIVLKEYGQKYHLQFADGTQKTYNGKELQFIKQDKQINL